MGFAPDGGQCWPQPRASVQGEGALAAAAPAANQITQLRGQLLEGPADVFGGVARPEPTAATVDVKTLDAKIGQLRQETIFWEERSAKPASRALSDDRSGA